MFDDLSQKRTGFTNERLPVFGLGVTRSFTDVEHVDLLVLPACAIGVGRNAILPTLQRAFLDGARLLGWYLELRAFHSPTTLRSRS